MKTTHIGACLLIAGVVHAADPGQGLIRIGSRRQLFVDEHLIERLKNTRFALNPAAKAPNNPVIRRDRPWEGNELHYASVLYDPERKQFRMWYQSSNFTPGKPDPVETDRRTCYATSTDGFHWDKPALGFVDFGGSKQNNILAPEHYLKFKGGIVRDAREPDPAKRFKALEQTGTDSTTQAGVKYNLYYSADAFTWRPYEGNPVIDRGAKSGRWGPTAMVGWDPIRNVYAVHMENCAHHRCSEGRRMIGRAESPDMIRWSPSETIIVPDEADSPDTEFYSMWATTYEDLYIGMLWNFRVTSTTILPQFVFSRDGIHYDRRYRQPFIPPSPEPQFDSVVIYALQPIVHDDRVFVYYGANNWRAVEQLDRLGADAALGAIGLATVPLDNFVSLDGAKREDSEVLTRSFTFSGSKLRLNLRAAWQGWGALPADVRVEILEPDHSPIPGYTLAEADPLTRTDLRAVATWRGRADVGPLAGKPVKLRIRFRNAKLFAFGFGD